MYLHKSGSAVSMINDFLTLTYTSQFNNLITPLMLTGRYVFFKTHPIILISNDLIFVLIQVTTTLLESFYQFDPPYLCKPLLFRFFYLSPEMLTKFFCLGSYKKYV